MKTSPEHPVSTFALDVYWTSARKGDGAADLERHLEGCARCRAYLAMLDGTNASAAGDAPPARPAPVRWLRPFRVAATATGALAFAAGVALLLQSALGTRTSPVYVGVKGTPSVQILVHHRSETTIWDGHAPVHAGDAIALRASCGDFASVSVASEDLVRGSWTRLSDARCPKDDDVLPFTLVVDGQSNDEHVAVVMSAARLPDGELDRAARDSERSPRTWVVRFVIPEERP